MLDKFKELDRSDVALRMCMLILLAFEIPVLLSLFTARSDFDFGWILVWAGTSLLFIEAGARSIQSWKEPQKGSFIETAALIAFGLALVSKIPALTTFFWFAGIFCSLLKLAEIWIPKTHPARSQREG